MIISKSIASLNKRLNLARKNGDSVHLIPTMGALHKGHASLIEQAAKHGGTIVASVFVNPTQFNQQADLSNYPRTFDHDKNMLEESGCTIMFFPSVKEIYPNDEKANYDLNGLDVSMEGEFRPGHFQGMVQVVNRLISIVKPNKAYFGQKDFQQLALVKHMMPKFGHPTEIIGCPTVRESSGLAMSSRNLLLSIEAKAKAAVIHKTLSEIKDGYRAGKSLEDLRKKGIDQINATHGFKLEYLEIVDPNTLTNITGGFPSAAVACVAAYIEGVRLIDNLTLFP